MFDKEQEEEEEETEGQANEVDYDMEVEPPGSLEDIQLFPVKGNTVKCHFIKLRLCRY